MTVVKFSGRGIQQNIHPESTDGIEWRALQFGVRALGPEVGLSESV
jgi:hypothetical protein